MRKDIEKLIDESIKLENNIGGLYEVFAKLFPEDKNFWRELVLEEKNHAAILRSGKESFLEANVFPEDILASSPATLSYINKELNRLIDNLQKESVSREAAFNIAYKLEKTAGEIHFQEYMDKEPESEMDRIFQQLNREDKNHAERILNYMENNNIPSDDTGIPEFLK
ncbi:MAG: hypothetical protein ACLFNJ_04750 [Bacteroidales bacterium]